MTYFLYAVTVLIWGSTWIAIKYQLNGTPEDVSIGARFIFAAIVLFAIAALSGRRIRLPRACWPMVATQGALMFCMNYVLVYRGTNYISSGLMAVIFTLLIPANQLNEFIFFRKPISGRVALAGLMGVAGVLLMFWPELRKSDWSDGALTGIGLGIASVYFASLGNMAAVINTGKQLPVTAVNAWGMLLGGTLSLGLAVALGETLHITWDSGYSWSFLYLSVFGSAIAFTCYLMLIERIGSARAAYSSVLLPIVAMLISTFFEDFRWSAMALIGVAIALVGNAMALTGKRRVPAKNT
ncbi:MAG: DMT family transporter [Gammaproteobacteria bacterium]